ncbi:hypothetical protein CEXT_252891 [Caerostris extrusa]|uniref:Uncharacterized protein n=1 Tax=Caerostris extrusa TaxID=172846 RepID=A0AAV4U6W1_CAEEX|nr:hypothetical protein CEXT_252891 [Caerostris extrusa]
MVAAAAAVRDGIHHSSSGDANDLKTKIMLGAVAILLAHFEDRQITTCMLNISWTESSHPPEDDQEKSPMKVSNASANLWPKRVLNSTDQ